MFSLPVTRKILEKEERASRFSIYSLILYVKWLAVSRWDARNVVPARVCVCVLIIILSTFWFSFFFLSGRPIRHYLRIKLYTQFVFFQHFLSFSRSEIQCHELCRTFLPLVHPSPPPQLVCLSSNSFKTKKQTKTKKRKRNFFHVLNVQHILLILISDVKFCPAFHYS